MVNALMNSVVACLVLATGMSCTRRPEYVYPVGFGDICATDADCRPEYHCSDAQGGRCTYYCPNSEGGNGCDTGSPDCDYCPNRCVDSGSVYRACDGLCAAFTAADVGECIVSY